MHYDIHDTVATGDLGTGRQLGWIPPTPFYLIKMARAKRQAMRSRH